MVERTCVLPEYQLPEFQLPKYQLQVYQLPEYQLPGIPTPKISTSHDANSQNINYVLDNGLTAILYSQWILFQSPVGHCYVQSAHRGISIMILDSI